MSMQGHSALKVGMKYRSLAGKELGVKHHIQYLEMDGIIQQVMYYLTTAPEVMKNLLQPI